MTPSTTWRPRTSTPCKRRHISKRPTRTSSSSRILQKELHTMRVVHQDTHQVQEGATTQQVPIHMSQDKCVANNKSSKASMLYALQAQDGVQVLSATRTRKKDTIRATKLHRQNKFDMRCPTTRTSTTPLLLRGRLLHKFQDPQERRPHMTLD